MGVDEVERVGGRGDVHGESSSRDGDVDGKKTRDIYKKRKGRKRRRLRSKGIGER